MSSIRGLLFGGDGAPQPEKAAQAKDNYGPKNFALLGRNALLAGFSLLVFGVSLNDYIKMKDHFIAMQSTVTAAPCATATPSAVKLLRGIGVAGFAWSPLTIPPTEESAATTIKKEICSSTNVYQAIRSLLGNSSMHMDVDENGITYNWAEGDLTESICNRYDPERKIYGEVRRRIATAYVLANPGFTQYMKDRTTIQDGCMRGNDPFPTTGACKYSEDVLQPELFKAANDPALVGYGELPPVSTMLYRLLALATIAESDRRQNSNACFSNRAVWNATELCQDIYSSVSTGSPPPPPAVPIGAHHSWRYQAIISTQTTCSQALSPNDSPPPSPPPAPDWNFVNPIAQGMGSVSPTIDACRNVHSFGHFDQESAFGIPDVAHPFSWQPSEFSFFGGWLYYALLDSKMDGLASYQTNPIVVLKIYGAYRFAAASVMMILIAVSCGFWIGISVMPSIGFLLLQCFGVKNKLSGRHQSLLSPRRGIVFNLAAVVTLLVWVYSVLLDPWLPAARAYTTSASCDDHSATGLSSVYSTSDSFAGPWEYLQQYFLLLLPVVSLLYCRWAGITKDEIERQLRLLPPVPRQTLWLVVSQLGCIIALSVVAVSSGEKWLKDTTSTDVEYHKYVLESANVLVQDLELTVVSAFTSGLASGLLRQRWVVDNLGYRIHFWWYAGVTVCIVYPFLVYTIEFWNLEASSTRSVMLVLFSLCSALSLLFVVFSIIALNGVVGGSVTGANGGSAGEAQVKQATQSTLRNRLYNRLGRFRARRSTASAAALPEALDNGDALPLLGLKIEPS